jgi:hypothetical protein
MSTPPPAEVGEPEPDALDKLIAEKFPEASEEARLKVKQRAMKRHERIVKSEQHRQPPVRERIEQAPTVEALDMLRMAITLGLQRGTLTPQRKVLDQWHDALWGRLCALIIECKRPGEASAIYNHARSWPKADGIASMLEMVFNEHVKRLPNDAEWLLSQGIEIEGITKLPRPRISLDLGTEPTTVQILP